jgi:hypothetical protein
MEENIHNVFLVWLFFYLGYLMIYIILLSLEEQVLRFLLLFDLKKVSKKDCRVDEGKAS